jgi:hypothetical protein
VVVAQNARFWKAAKETQCSLNSRWRDIHIRREHLGCANAGKYWQHDLFDEQHEFFGVEPSCCTGILSDFIIRMASLRTRPFNF